MTKLSEDAQRIIEKTRHQGSPLPRDKARIREAIDAAIASPAQAPGQSDALPKFSKTTPWRSVLIIGVAAIIVSGIWLFVGRGPGTESIEMTSMKTAKSSPAMTANPAPKKTQTTPPSTPSSPAIPFYGPEGTEMENTNDAKPEVQAVGTNRPPLPRKNERKIKTQSGTLEAELRLLGAAQKARKNGNYGEAIKLLGDHRTKFPRGVLSAEREAALALTLCDADEWKKAVRVAKRFLKRYPKSPLGHSVRQSCAFNRAKKSDDSSTDSMGPGHQHRKEAR